MIHDDQITAPADIAATIRARQEADLLLLRLLSDREGSEQRFAEAGKNDPVKNVTGVSALDRAIARTRDMIRRLNQRISRLDTFAPRPVTVPSNLSANGTHGDGHAAHAARDANDANGATEIRIRLRGRRIGPERSLSASMRSR